MTEIMKAMRFIITAVLAMTASSQMVAQNDSQAYSDYLKEHAEEPVGYVLSKLKGYRLVAIGEDHWIADHTPFLCEVLREAAAHDDTRPDIVALEFGNEIDQKTANYVTHSPIFAPDSVVKILQHAPDVYGNTFKEYFDVFKCIWEINQTLPEEDKIYIGLLDPAGVQDSFNKTSIQRGRDRDMSMYEKLRVYLMKGNKVIFYAGQTHTQRQIRGYMPRNRDFYYNYPSAGFLIKSSYPNDVYTIDLWSPINMGLGYERNPQTGTWYEKSEGKFDKAFEANGNKPCGFDIRNTIWGDITMMEYFCPPGKGDEYYPSHPKDGNPYTREVLLSQLVDGIVFVKPSSSFTGGTLINIYTPDFVEVCRQRSGGKLTTPESILRRVNEWHPLMRMPE